MQSATCPALRPNDHRPQGHAKSRSPQGCMNVFLDPLGQGAADSIRNLPSLGAKRPSPPRARQIPQPARLHECFLEPFRVRFCGRSPQTTRPKAVTTGALESALNPAARKAARMFFSALWDQLLRAQLANYPAKGRNYRRSGERPKSRSPQGCITTF